MRKSSFGKANLILNIMVALFLSFFVVHSQIMLVGGWLNSFRPFLIGLCSTLILSPILHLLYAIFFWTIAFRKHVPAMLGSYVLATLGLIFDTYYFGLNGQHLDWEGVNLTWNGWLSGEIGNPLLVPLAIFAVVLVAYGLFWLLFRFWGLVTQWAPIRSKITWVVFLLVIPACSVLTARMIVPGDFRMSELSETLPWAKLFGVGNQIDFSGYKFFEKPSELSIQTEVSAMRNATKALKNIPEHIEAERKPDILVIGIEGWRFDMFQPEICPKLYAWQKKGLVHLPKHYSTGNTTPSSMFGLLSGLNGFFYQAHLETGESSFLLEFLSRMGYTQTAWDISGLKYNSLFDKQFKPSGFSLQTNRPLNKEKWEKDSLLLNQLADSILLSSEAKPRLDFFMYYSTHYNYFYPEAYAKFQPASDIDGLNSGLKPNLREYRTEIFNKYKNSIFFMDTQIDRLLSKLDSAGKLQNRIVVITGDHGEEFWEDGTFGHSFRLDDWQTRTTTLIRFPTPLEIKYTTTSHADILPTIFEWMGVKTDWKRFVSGKSLQTYQPNQDYAVILKGGKEKFLAYRAALVEGDYKIYFQNRWNLNKNLEEVRYRDSTVLEFPMDSIRNMLSKIPLEKEFYAQRVVHTN